MASAPSSLLFCHVGSCSISAYHCPLESGAILVQFFIILPQVFLWKQYVFHCIFTNGSVLLFSTSVLNCPVEGILYGFDFAETVMEYAPVNIVFSCQHIWHPCFLWTLLPFPPVTLLFACTWGSGESNQLTFALLCYRQKPHQEEPGPTPYVHCSTAVKVWISADAALTNSLPWPFIWICTAPRWHVQEICNILPRPTWVFQWNLNQKYIFLLCLKMFLKFFNNQSQSKYHEFVIKIYSPQSIGGLSYSCTHNQGSSRACDQPMRDDVTL